MKPVELKLKNIGPFGDADIDFNQLSNIFLITGKTGAGKTFIFDAMTYALYGCLCGNRKDHERDLRSRYAKPGDNECYVEFTFEIAGEQFRVNRTVTFTKAGNKNETASVVFLERKLKGEKDFVPFPGLEKKGLNETNRKIQEIIGLTSDEFSRIVLLPQGAFAEFLKQNSDKRQKTLEKLFPVGEYSRITEEVKNRCDRFDSEIKSVKSIISGEEESVKNSGMSFDDAEEKILEMKGKVQVLEKESEEIGKKLIEYASLETKLKKNLETAEKNEKNIQRKNELEGKKVEINLIEDEISKAEKAAALKEPVNESKRTVENEKLLKTALENAEKELASSEELLDGLREKENSMKELKKQNEKDKTELDSLGEKLKKAGEFNEAVKNEKEFKEKRDGFEKKLSDVLKEIGELKSSLNGEKIETLISGANGKVVALNNEKNRFENLKKDGKTRDSLEKAVSEINGRIRTLEESVKKAEEKVLQTENTINLKKKELEKAKNQNAAFSLASLLKAGEPCPVCGSKEHPAPAEKGVEFLSEEGEISAFEDSFKLKQKELNGLNADLSSEKARLSENASQLKAFAELVPTEKIISDAEENENALENAEKELKDLTSLQERIAEKLSSKESLSAEFSKADSGYESAKSKRETLEKETGSDFEEIQKKFGLLSEKYSGNVKLYENWNNSLNDAEKKNSAKKSTRDEKRLAYEKASEEKLQAQKVLEENLKLSVFGSVEEALKYMLSLEEINERRKICTGFNEELKSVTDAVNNAEKVQPLVKIREELEKLENEKAETAEKSSGNKSRLDESKKLLVTYENSWNRIHEQKARLLVLEKEKLPCQKLLEHLSGKNTAAVPFDTWALGMYFDQVVDFASRRFFEISNHRFEFILKDFAEKKGNGFKGLDLQVIDHNTPDQKPSDTADLSGGETFEASISLALAITDVVQNNSGGISLDSLFIDEGFGTLDPEPLESTMKVLTELSETKMIGLISHVESLENSEMGITSQINVHKTDHGSTVTIK